MLAIKNNIMAQGASRHLGTSYNNLSTSVRRLASGLRIESAKDDAAGLAVRELVRKDVARLEQGARNAQDGISMLQASEGALDKIDAGLTRMRTLVEQANTGTYSSGQKQIMQNEFDAIAVEITRIANSTEFNGNNILDDTNANELIISLGQGNATGTVGINSTAMTANALGVGGAKTTNVAQVSIDDTNTSEYIDFTAAGTLTLSFGSDDVVLTVTAATTMTLDGLVTAINNESNNIDSTWEAASVVGNATEGYSLKLTNKDAGVVTATVTGGVTEWGADTVATGVAVADGAFTEVAGSASLDITADVAATIDTAIETKDTFRAELGYKMNRLQMASEVLDVQAENLLAAESRISDVDVAKEMTSLTRNQVLAQAGVSMLSQANSMPQMALSLLQG